MRIAKGTPRHPVRRGRLQRALPVVAIVLVLLPAAAAPAQGGGVDFLRRSLDVELRLLRQDLEEVRIARAAQVEAQRRLDDVMTQVRSIARSQATASGATATNLQNFAERVADTSAEAEAAASRSRTALVRLEMRLQRAGMLADMLARGDLPAVPDVLTGRWQVEVGPEGTGGVFELDQDGTLVGGTFRLDDGSRGSLRGTLVGNSVRLEQVDDRRGFSAIYEGRLDPAAGTLSGFWRPTDLSGGAPGGGDWTASKTSGGSS